MKQLALAAAAAIALGAAALVSTADAAGGIVPGLRAAPIVQPHFVPHRTHAQPQAHAWLRPAPAARPVFAPRFAHPAYRPTHQPVRLHQSVHPHQPVHHVAPVRVAAAQAGPFQAGPFVAQPALQPALQPAMTRPAYAQQGGFVQPAFAPQPAFTPQGGLVGPGYANPAFAPAAFGAVAIGPHGVRAPRPRHNNLVKLGVGSFFLQDSSSDIRGDLTPENLQVDVNDRTVLAGSYTRFFGDHFGIEIPFGAPVKFGIDAAGPGEGLLSVLTASLDQQEVVTVDALPITAIGNVYFTDRDADVRPYLGLAINHTRFSNADASEALEAAILGETTIDLENSTNIGAFAGLNVRLTDNLHASVLGGFVNVDTTATITTDTVLPLTPEFNIPLGEFTREVDVELNPLIGLATLGFSF